MQNKIFVKGIETNNLKNINIEIVKNAINLILGPSGSGKSTLAYETIAQIGQHEYMSMFADDISEPTYQVQSFRNMLPAVPIKQTNHNNNSRSSIGTYFGINRKICLIYSALLNMDDGFFLLTKEDSVCEKCHGLGRISVLDINKIVDYNVSIKNIPFRCWNRYKEFYSKILCNYCEDCGIDFDKSFRELTESEKWQLLYGVSDRKYSIKYKKLERISSRTTKYYGVMSGHEMLPGCSTGKAFYSDVECDNCHGMQYNDKFQDYKIYGLSIGEFFSTEFDILLPIVEKMILEISNVQLKFALNRVHDFIWKAVELKLGHLYFNRSIPTLSGGELQRLRLVQVFNTQLSNLLIILDEPLVGLSTNEKPIVRKNIVELSRNNTVVIVDHGTTFLDMAKKIICLGEGGGIHGGYIIDTANYIKQQTISLDFRAPQCDEFFTVKTNTKVYHYMGVNVNIALGRMNLVTGDSGVGKSTLLREYFPQVFDHYIYINQKPMLGNKNSTVATVLDIFTRISSIYGLKFKKDKKFFSNQTGNEGCCKKCSGVGYVEYGNKEMSLLRIECQECQGTGFNIELQKYKIGGKSIFDVWQMTIEEAAEYYHTLDNRIHEVLADAESVMLGHLKLGQSTSTLSGGENIRLKMLKVSHSSAKILGIDEPFKGLNNAEKNAVGFFLDDLRKTGKTIVVIDHTEGIDYFFSNHVNVKKIENIIVG